MSSYSNSDPKQCIVPKLGHVHSAHTQNLGRVAARTPCAGAVSQWLGAVSCCVVCARVRCRTVSLCAHSPLSRQKENCVAIQNHVARALDCIARALGRVARAARRVACCCRSPLCACLAARLAMRAQALCCDTTCCIASMTGKWAVAHPSFSLARFFFHLLYSL